MTLLGGLEPTGWIVAPQKDPLTSEDVSLCFTVCRPLRHGSKAVGIQHFRRKASIQRVHLWSQRVVYPVVRIDDV